MLPVLADGLLCVVIGLLIWIAWYDFKHLTILNRSALLVAGLYLPWAALGGFATFTTDLIAATILFLLGFVLWLLRLMGAGDVKLYFGLGLFMGMQGLGVFAGLLLIASVLFFVMMTLASRSATQSGVIAKFRDFKEAGKLPYAVLMCAAAIPTILLRMIGAT